MSGAPAPRFGWFGDDFTGATDTLSTFAEAGLRALLLTRLPEAAQLARIADVEALGVAGATRAMDPAAIAATLAPVGALFARLGVRVLHYKCCSTFDSSPGVGNLAAAVHALRAAYPAAPTAIIGGQPNLRRYCVFGTLFAAAGAEGDMHRIDRHPTMSRHPVTPMGEADLRRHLQAQGFGAITGVDYPVYEAADADARLGALFEAAAARGDDALLFDVSRAADLVRIGACLRQRAAKTPLLVLGASSVAQALCAGAPRRPPDASPPAGQGAVFALVGSLSPVTRRQAQAASSYERITFDVARVAADPAHASALIADMRGRLAQGRHVLAITREPEGERLPGHAAAAATARLARDVLREGSVRRACIAGGDTSSLFMQSIDGWALRHRRALGPGAALCELLSDDPRLDGLRIALKGGQMGTPDFFEAFLRLA